MCQQKRETIRKETEKMARQKKDSLLRRVEVIDEVPQLVAGRGQDEAVAREGLPSIAGEGDIGELLAAEQGGAEGAQLKTLIVPVEIR